MIRSNDPSAAFALDAHGLDALRLQAKRNPEQALRGVAQQFEAIFVRQMLSAARKADFGDSMFGGQAMDTFRQMQDERFADIAAQSGAFGLASPPQNQCSPSYPRSRRVVQTFETQCRFFNYLQISTARIREVGLKAHE